MLKPTGSGEMVILATGYEVRCILMQFLMCLCYVHSIPNEILQTDISTQINSIQIFFFLVYFSSWSINFLFLLLRSSKPFLASSDFLEAIFWSSCATWIPENDSACFKFSLRMTLHALCSLQPFQFQYPLLCFSPWLPLLSLASVVLPLFPVSWLAQLLFLSLWVTLVLSSLWAHAHTLCKLPCTV